jgi:heme/copper-type cytochrome/quinol oxidase subunit 2
MRHCADGARCRSGETQASQAKGGAMHTWMNGWDWLWMTLMMGFWLVVLGAVIYLAVRLAQRPPTRPRADS